MITAWRRCSVLGILSLLFYFINMIGIYCKLKNLFNRIKIITKGEVKYESLFKTRYHKDG
ncbi:hypothetical protein acsn021_11930 [Anaerocolumna cellulosilytica]|uniref:Uncharacterized protein n=1 Tax=Anaerocolumna cellulosilytica TaxID=433286 RepID=A0A6S6QSN9_9FIRM|nr:hypothetical protein acsn021_11930 [Anaerocolumna cellulosilytica]